VLASSKRGKSEKIREYRIHSKILKALATAKTYTIDSRFIREQLKTYTIDSAYRALASIKTYTIDTVLKALATTKTYTIDSRFVSGALKTKTYTIDSVFTGGVVIPKISPSGSSVIRHKRRKRGVDTTTTVHTQIQNSTETTRRFVSNLRNRTDVGYINVVVLQKAAIGYNVVKSSVRDIVGELVSSPIKGIFYPSTTNQARITLTLIKKSVNTTKTKIKGKVDKYVQKAIDVITVEDIVDSLDE